MAKKKLTDALVTALEPAEKQYLVRDTEVPGFFVMVGARTKTWTIQIDVTDLLTGKAKTRRQSLGGFPDVGTREARRLAEEARAELRKGRPKGSGQTLAEAWRELRDELAADGKSLRTIEGYEYGMSLLSEWHDTPLAKLAVARGDIRKRWNQIKTGNGPGAANSFVKTLRRVYRHALALDDNLPPMPPTFGMKVATLKAKETKARPTSMNAEGIASWRAKLDALPSEVQQTFWWFMLLSGARTGALSRARWADLDRERRVLHIPQDKTGPYDIPLTDEMLESLDRAAEAGRKLNPRAAQTYIWPARPNRNGEKLKHDHIHEPKPKTRDQLPLYNHDLRRSWATFAKEAGVPKDYRNVLGNWGDADMADLYVNRSNLNNTLLLAEQQKITEYIVQHASEK